MGSQVPSLVCCCMSHCAVRSIAASSTAIARVEAKLDEFFALSALSRIDARAAERSRLSDAEMASLDGADAARIGELVASAPIAVPSPDEALSLTGPVNPAFRDAVRDFAEVEGDGKVTAEVAHSSLLKLEVDERGLDEMDRRIMEAVIRRFSGGPVGVKSLAVAVGEGGPEGGRDHGVEVLPSGLGRVEEPGGVVHRDQGIEGEGLPEVGPSGDGTAVLAGTPTNDEVGTHDVTLVVQDTSGAATEQIFVIEVLNTNDPPFFTITPNTIAA